MAPDSKQAEMMACNRIAVQTWLDDTKALSCENLALKLDKLNTDIDLPKGKGGAKKNMVEALAAFEISPSLKQCYTHAFNKRKERMESLGNTEIFSIRATSPVLVGMGTFSIHEFGVKLSHPWGVPMISGSTLKGLVSSYLSASGDASWKRDGAGGEKSDPQVELFGGVRKGDGKAYAGSLCFHDAWLDPSCRERWFVADTITVHHSLYYAGERLPGGTESPIPIPMAALSRGVVFHIAVSGNENERHFARDMLLEALAQNGIGGKTAVGYGRLEKVRTRQEKYDDLAAMIGDAGFEALVALAQQHGRQDTLYPAFNRAVRGFPMDAATLNLYERFDPWGYLWNLCSSGQVNSLQALNKKFKGVRDNIHRFGLAHGDVYVPQYEPAQKLFDHALGVFGVTEAEIEGHAVLKQIAYTWDDVAINDDTILELVDSLDKRVWPPASLLKSAIEASPKLDDEKKKMFLELLE